mgnify:CR=1 FL=1
MRVTANFDCKNVKNLNLSFITVMTHCMERGQEIITGKMNHIFQYEAGGSSHVSEFK